MFHCDEEIGRYRWNRARRPCKDCGKFFVPVLLDAGSVYGHTTMYRKHRRCHACQQLHGKKTGRNAAIEAVNKSVRNGTLRPATEFDCVDCAKPATCYEHRDYNKPLEVVPVCHSCNRKRGAAIPAKAEQ